ncbi:MAG TPA: FAD-linked oxidase C-terminal domain-containing protein [Dehalococcoidia bacterium]
MLAQGLLSQLQGIVGAAYVVHRPEDLLVYEFDATIERALPDAVVLPADAEQVAAVVRLARQHGLPVVPRGAGTGLSGGAVACEGGIVIGTARMNRILEVDAASRVALVQPGVVNAALSQAVAPYGLYYAPDPSSQKACTLGGNVAENAGGPHCLAYGTTTNHVLGLELVLPDGELVWLGGRGEDRPGYDLRGVVVGSEGTLGIVTAAAVRLLPKPEDVRTLLAIFDHVDGASRAVSAVIAAGVVPAALEMMDRPVMDAVEAAYRLGYPPDAGAVLLVEVDGLREYVAEAAEEVAAICAEHGAREVRVAESAEDRERLWAGRKGAISALGQLAPNYYILDGVVPRTRLPEVLRQVYEIVARHGLRVANVFHAGDGNLHPCILFDEREPDATRRVLDAGGEIMRLCVDAGGSITGEHGVGYEKRDYLPWIFSEEDMDVMRRLRAAFGAGEQFNPGKVFPTNKGCGEFRAGNPLARLPDAYI